MTTQRKRAGRRLSRIAGALLVVTFVAALMAPSAGAGSGSGKLPDTITIGYQNIPNGDLVVKNLGYLEKAFGDDVEIEWKLFDSGGLVNEAVVAGGIDIGLAGSSPVSRGLSTGIEYRIPWIFDVIGDAEALVVKSDIDSVKDLKGKTIATPLASTAHYSLLAAIQDAGLEPSDVDIIDAEPDAILASWQAGDIDGAYVWNPTLAAIVDDGGRILLTSTEVAEQGKTTYDLGVVTDEFAKEYPEAVKIWVEQQNEAVELIKKNPKKAAKAVAAELNITPEEVLEQFEGLIFLTASEQVGTDYLGGGLADNLFAAAEFNRDLDQIPSVEPKSVYEKAVVKKFAQQVADGG